MEASRIAEKTFAVSYIGTFVCALQNTDWGLAVDFFTYGFDGSGADNYFDAGSCIDGRLTSAWNCK